SIKGYLQIVKTKDLPAKEQQDYFNIAMELSVNLEKLVNDFFKLSKIASGDYVLKQERINITRLTNEMVLSFYSDFTEKGIEPAMNISTGPLFIINDLAAVRRVLENLLSNVLQYAEGDIEIGVRKNRQSIILWVQNSAELTAAANNPEILFDRFYIADKSRTGESTGLGHSVTKSLLDIINGRICVHYDGDKLI